MKIVFADESLLDILNAIADGSGAGLFWKLFENNVTPDSDSVVADFTFATAAWGEIQVPLASFTLQQVAAHQASIQAPDITFTNGDAIAVTLFGYVVTNAAKTKVIAAARFDDAPITLAVGSPFAVTPVLGLESLYTSG